MKIKGHRSFWNGHILGIIRIGQSSGAVRISAAAEGLNPAVWDTGVE